MTFLQRHAYDIGYGFARLLLPFFGRRVKLSVANIMRGGVTDDKKEAERIARAAFCHFAGHIGEALFVPNVVTKENWREHLDLTDMEPESAHLMLSADEPIIIASSHHGTWEPATNIISYSRPMIAIARKMNSKFAENWLRKHHFRGSITVVDKNHGMTPDVVRQWEEEKAAMTLLLDQFCHNGPVLRFFGRPARTFTTGARLAIRTGFPMLVGSFIRVGPYQYKAISGKPIRAAKGMDRNALAQEINDRFEAIIRQYPEQYLWAHKRWRDD